MPQPETSPCSDASEAALLGVCQLWNAQNQRAAEYAKLDKRYQQYLRTGNEAAYREQLAASTASFQESSLLVRNAIALLEGESSHIVLVELLRTLQKDEQARLRFTLILQALKKAEAAGNFSWQWHKTAQSDQHLHDEVDPVHSCGCSQGVPEPSATEFENALKEAYQELQGATQRINETLEEVRYVEEDLREKLAE